MLENGYPDSTVTRDLDSLSSNIPDINVIVISDKNGLRFYHTNRLKTGDSYVAGDEDAILAGSDPYITTGYGTHGMQRRAFHAVKNSDGEIVGFVMVSLFTATLSAQHRSLLFFYIIIFLIMMIVSISLTHTMFSLLRDSLLGYDPEELVNIYTRQDEVMNLANRPVAIAVPIMELILLVPSAIWVGTPAIRYAGSEINPPPPAIASTKPARNTIGQTIINCSIVQSMLHPPKFSCTPKFLLPSQNRNQKALRAYISILIAKTPPVHRY